MATNRTPISRTPQARITPDVLALWKRLRTITPREQEHRRRREYLDGTKQLCRSLGLWWGDAANPLNVDGPTPPHYMINNLYQSARWREAWHWQCTLIEAEHGYSTQAY